MLSCASTPVSVFVHVDVTLSTSVPNAIKAKLSAYTPKSSKAPPAKEGFMIRSFPSKG